MPALPTNLARVGAVYKFRSRIPTDLLAFYAPKREITESLRTKSLTEAKRLLPTVQLKYQQEWANLRAAMNADLTELVLNDAGIQYVVTLLEYESLTGDEARRTAQNYDIEEIRDYRNRLADSIAHLRDAAAVGDLATIRPAVEQYLHLKKLKPIGQPADFDRLALAYLRAAIRTNEALLARMNGEQVDLRTLPPSPPNRKLPAIPATGARTSLYSLFEYWRDAVANRPQRTIDDFERRVQAFDQLTGNKPVEQLTRADFVAYRDARLKQGKSPGTVEKDLSFLKAILAHALDSEKIPTNPAAGIKVPKNEMARCERHLDTDDLNALFASPIYNTGTVPAAGGGDAAAWLPLLALYTGARLEELAQLLVEDVKTDGKIPHLRILDLYDDLADKDVKRLKNAGSRRLIPIPQTLIDHGFLDYVHHQRRQKSLWLFPDLKEDKAYGRRGGNWSKWWSRWRATLGVTGRDKCFHAFRHTFKTACRAAEVREDVHDAITGHTGGGIGRDYGRFPLEALKPAIDRVRYSEVRLQWKWQAPASTT